MAKAKSMKGEIVDFDLLKIKQQMESSPPPIEVSERKEFINNKLQRRVKKAKDDILAAKKAAENVQHEAEQKSKPKTIKKAKK